MSKRNKSFQVSLEAEAKMNPLKMTKEEMTLEELAEGYLDNSLNECGGVVSMNGLLNIRPEFQRSYVVENNTLWIHKLIHSVLNHRPIGLMYWGEVSPEIKVPYKWVMIDGQQRLMTLAEFIHGNRPIPILVNGESREVFFRGLPVEWQKEILNYKVEVYICRGSEEEQIRWFQTINQKSSILTEQELRNTAFTGSKWLENAKWYFSAPRSGYKHQINDKNSKYCMVKYAAFSGDANGDGTRQELLEKAIEWISYPDKDKSAYDPIMDYMIAHKDDEDASELINYYKNVVDWAWETFLDVDNPFPYTSFRSVDWGRLYAEYHDQKFDTKYVSKRVRELLDNYGEMSKPSGVYEYVLRGEKEEDEILMGFRSFDKGMVEKRYIEQGGCDPITGVHYDLPDMHAHHIVAVENGGKRDYDNLVLLSPESHRKYAHGGEYNKHEIKAIRDAWIAKISKEHEV